MYVVAGFCCLTLVVLSSTHTKAELNFSHVYCNGEMINSSCPVGHYINISVIWYVYHHNIWQPQDCRAPIHLNMSAVICAKKLRFHHGDLHNEFVAKCEGRQQCENLIANTTIRGKCKDYTSPAEYVRLVYKCLSNTTDQTANNEPQSISRLSTYFWRTTTRRTGQRTTSDRSTPSWPMTYPGRTTYYTRTMPPTTHRTTSFWRTYLTTRYTPKTTTTPYPTTSRYPFTTTSRGRSTPYKTTVYTTNSPRTTTWYPTPVWTSHWTPTPHRTTSSKPATSTPTVFSTTSTQTPKSTTVTPKPTKTTPKPTATTPKPPKSTANPANIIRGDSKTTTLPSTKSQSSTVNLAHHHFVVVVTIPVVAVICITIALILVIVCFRRKRQGIKKRRLVNTDSVSYHPKDKANVPDKNFVVESEVKIGPIFLVDAEQGYRPMYLSRESPNPPGLAHVHTSRVVSGNLQAAEGISNIEETLKSDVGVPAIEFSSEPLPEQQFTTKSV